jgi:hypothetical protein
VPQYQVHLLGKGVPTWTWQNYDHSNRLQLFAQRHSKHSNDPQPLHAGACQQPAVGKKPISNSRITNERTVHGKVSRAITCCDSLIQKLPTCHQITLQGHSLCAEVIRCPQGAHIRLAPPLWTFNYTCRFLVPRHNFQQDGQCMQKVTFWRVNVISVAVGKQYNFAVIPQGNTGPSQSFAI